MGHVNSTHFNSAVTTIYHQMSENIFFSLPSFRQTSFFSSQLPVTPFIVDHNNKHVLNYVFWKGVHNFKIIHFTLREYFFSFPIWNSDVLSGFVLFSNFVFLELATILMYVYIVAFTGYKCTHTEHDSYTSTHISGTRGMMSDAGICEYVCECAFVYDWVHPSTLHVLHFQKCYDLDY